MYRALYILNWIYRFFTEPNYRQWIGALLCCKLACFHAGCCMLDNAIAVSAHLQNGGVHDSH